MNNDRMSMGGIPGGMELLLKRAALDGDFRQLLLRERSRVAELAGLTLTATESAMLDTIPQAQLAAIISHTRVEPGWRHALIGCTTAALLAALGTATPALGTENLPGYNAITIETPDSAGDKLTQGVLSGKVKDYKGRKMPNTEIAIVGTNLTVVSGEDGHYVIPNVPAGIYNVSFSHSGFAVKMVYEVEIKAGKVTVLNAILSVTEPQLYGGSRP